MSSSPLSGKENSRVVSDASCTNCVRGSVVSMTGTGGTGTGTGATGIGNGLRMSALQSSRAFAIVF